MKHFKKLFAIGCLSTLSLTVQALPVNQVDYFSLTGTVLIDFEGLAGGSAPGTNYDGIIDLDGASFGERFAGQTLSYSGNSDVLSGTPTGGLSLVTGDPGENLNVYTRTPDGNILTGLGHLGFPDFNAIGEGAIAILFDNDQSEFGFQSVGGDLGGATFQFWNRAGDLIDTIMPTNLGTDYFGFSREGGVYDIAGISIWNTDPAGIGFDDIIFDVPATGIPAPGPLALLAIGLIAIGFSVKRKQI